MNENISMTKISDLPDSHLSVNVHSQGLSNTYLPMDVHPNPYGMPPPPAGGIMPPQHTQPRENMESINYSEHTQKLPQRDIPMNITEHIQDQEIQANYIPPSKITKDYIQEYQKENDTKIREREIQKSRDRISESWLDKLHMPIFISLLYFVFQLPIINTLIFKRFSFLAIYNEDGNFNVIGLTLKSICFASVYAFVYYFLIPSIS
jgi:hypothetical protein